MTIPAPIPEQTGQTLFERVAALLDAGRSQVLCNINHATVLTYWQIGREIVHALQGGHDKADYGKSVLLTSQ